MPAGGTQQNYYPPQQQQQQPQQPRPPSNPNPTMMVRFIFFAVVSALMLVSVVPCGLCLVVDNQQ